MEESYVDCASEAAGYRWASICAALTPRLLLAPRSDPTLFRTPWRGPDSLVLRVRERIDGLPPSGRGWASELTRSALGSYPLGPEEALLAAYALCRLLGGLGTVAQLCAPLAVLCRTPWRPSTWLRPCGKCLFGALRFAELGPRDGSLRFFEEKLRDLLLGSVAAFLLPPELLAVHVALCSCLGLAARLRPLLRRLSF